ncbi:MAG: carbamoyltransferase HypF [Candidatus Terraquivivens tikiterensis]|uniref:Carbamoyltransferase n=1 Tax=Candidatus Terraquivivens tikiterensis TaxID=1980982 RepID=A0A2R7Y9H5_9ARCH|nr:MAG: carbamoyltransferase HypF [Candidatus Terraquivivens tikiterensis]
MGKVRAEVRVSGIVQGVGFRPFVYRAAVGRGLKGFVQNLKDASVRIVVEGPEPSVRSFLDALVEERPPLAIINKFDVSYSEPKEEFTDFRILESSEQGSVAGSVIPADVAICEDCVKELLNPADRRFGYFFITCTNCGPRFTITLDTPYDRKNTSMKDFPMCKSCSAEYENPLDRRFHAQTIACPECGPRVYLTTNDGMLVECKDPISEAAKLIDEGYIVAVKGNGGFHVATATTISEPILRLRRVKHRRQKPFAVMAKDLKSVKSFAIVGSQEEALLTSPARPIVLLRKSENYYLSDEVAPGLHTVGVMLPYTGLHLLLLLNSKEPAYVMTSANPPGEPIVIKDQEAYVRIGREVDYMLLHNREIVNRCDDSVVRVVDGSVSQIRRSRGYAPEPISLRHDYGKEVVALGGELNVAGCILMGDKAFLTQHIGDVECVETYEFLESAISYLARLTRAKPEVIAHDLHPGFQTTRLAEELAEMFGVPRVAVQHHHAHVASVMAEHGLDEVVGIACDGFGYGDDGLAWGGEVLLCDGNGYRRVGHLENHPMPGGDLAAKYPVRMAAGILSGSDLCEEWLFSNADKLPRGRVEAEIVLKQIRSGRSVKTSSAGRVLDSVAAILGVCYERTYEGEPAMKLESIAIGGSDVLGLRPEISGRILRTRCMVESIAEMAMRGLDLKGVRDLAFSAQDYLASGLAELALEVAEDEGIKNVAFTGGVAYNEQIRATIRRRVEAKGLRFYTNVRVPPGDGGLSFGQAVVAAGWASTARSGRYSASYA